MLIVAALLSLLFAQQHTYTTTDIEDGRRIYQSSCGTCHGALGDAVPGIDLGRGQFRRSVTDDDVAHTIRTGVAGTSMPPFNFSEPQALTVIAYLRNMTASAGNAVPPFSGPAGDATRGRAVIEGKGACLTCHWLNGAGNNAGPDLSVIGAPRTGRSPAELQRSLIDPNAEVRPENRLIRVVTLNGATVTARLMNQDTHSIQLLDPNKGLTSFQKSDLRDYALVDSLMPSFKDRLTTQELSDVISYLLSLKGQSNE